MADMMARLRAWLRPPRNLLVLFLLVIFLPAATLIFLGVHLLEQDRALASQRQTEVLDRAADLAVRALELDLARLKERLAAGSWGTADVPEGSVHVTFGSDRIEVSPPGRLPYYPIAPSLKESPDAPFAEMEAQEFKEQNLEKALETGRKIAASSDVSLRAGALLRLARILRKMGRPNDALEAYRDLNQIGSVAIAGTPADLVARRARCAVFEERSRTEELRREAESIASDLRGGRWQLDRASFEHVATQLGRWLGSDVQASDEGVALAAGVEWLWKNRTSPPGFRFLSFDGVPVTIVWSAGAAFIAGPRYLGAHWLEDARQAARPAQAYLLGAGNAPPAGVRRVQRSAADTGLPWAVIVAGSNAVEESSELAARRRILLAGLAALLVLVGAGSYFIWRSVTRELAVARLQSDFVSAVSHEFRTPLTSLRQFNQLLIDDDNVPPEKRSSYYHAQARATDRLHRLVESLLDFGRMEAGRRPYRFERLDAGALAKDVAQEFQGEAGGQGFSLQCSVNSGEYPVDADSEALSRAVWNLLDNAAKYSGDSRKIELSLDRAGGAVSIAVRDYGLGIPVSEQERIFQKFVRGSAARLQGIKGTGIGLAMVRHIVDAHGGSIQVKSSPDEGSTFTIVLPARG
jgi:signal transduction histidine kinase